MQNQSLVKMQADDVLLSEAYRIREENRYLPSYMYLISHWEKFEGIHVLLVMYVSFVSLYTVGKYPRNFGSIADDAIILHSIGVMFLLQFYGAVSICACIQTTHVMEVV